MAGLAISMTPVLEILMSKAQVSVIDSDDSHLLGGTLGSRLGPWLEMGLKIFLQSRQLLIPNLPLPLLLSTIHGF